MKNNTDNTSLKYKIEVLSFKSRLS